MRLRDAMERVVRGELAPPPVATLLGISLAPFKDGEAVVTLAAGDSHTNPMGTAQGGVLGALTGGCVRAVNLLCLAPLEPRLVRWAPFSNRPRGGALMRLMLLAIVLFLLAPPAFAQIAVSVNDNKVMLDNGTVKVVPNAPPDTLSVIDLKSTPPRVVSEIPVPGSVVGPPFSVAITPDEGLALVTAAMKVDPSDPTKQVADNRLSVVDLRANPPQVIATLEAGKGAAGVSINRQGNLALVANRSEGTVSVYSIHGRTVTPAGKVTLGDEKTDRKSVV